MITFIDSDEAEWEMNDLRAQVQAERRYARALAANPDCRDPDHPGCDSCNETKDSEE
jgi:hypothetical protein